VKETKDSAAYQTKGDSSESEKGWRLFKPRSLKY
jgi:hypothetical protein